MLRIKKAEFVTSCSLGSALPELGGAAQIAMVGKSNVGKSSFINAVCNNSKLARTSSTPGKTRLINFFSINGGEFYLVDLPGYGFAKAPKTEQGKWAELMEGYLRSGHVSHLFLLLDSRHEPTVADRQMLVWMQYYNIPYTIIATKVDKLPKTRRKAAAASVSKAIGALGPAIAFSAAEKLGIDDVLNRIEQIVTDEARTFINQRRSGDAEPAED
ncbi:MAG: ribosome biogenesis GTP-binding protein YihA/YsxC [Christensenellales bacterium]|jgi:GTP-binding protein